MLLATFYWGGAQVSWLRIALTVAGELLLVAYLLWAWRILRR
ncbi:MAG TPA: hypothetical protein VGJ34_09685 [Gaiellaceae bacterium]|jgi:hypothetical protein